MLSVFGQDNTHKCTCIYLKGGGGGHSHQRARPCSNHCFDQTIYQCIALVQTYCTCTCVYVTANTCNDNVSHSALVDMYNRELSAGEI